MQIGVEYNPLAGKVSPLVNWRLLGESDRRPALIAGTSSDRIGTPSGQSFYLTASKDLSAWLVVPIAPYVGVAYGTFEDKARAIAGVNVGLPANLSSLIIYDGVKVHPTLNYTSGRHVVSILLAHGRDPGASYSVRF
jgi:hypothetical protein